MEHEKQRLNPKGKGNIGKKTKSIQELQWLYYNHASLVSLPGPSFNCEIKGNSRPKASDVRV